jgi:hypothetical protein
MYLAEVEIGTVEAATVPEVSRCSAAWRDWPVSTISHHGRACCDIAREWILATDCSQLGDAATLTGPRWLRQRYPWGPSPWPLHWCEAAERKRLDCGAHAAIAHELFSARGVKSRPAQFVQQFSEDATRHWADKWREEEIAAAWIDRDLIYHEGCAVALGGDEIKLWDASAGWWIDNPRQSGGYGSLLSVRVLAREGESFRWEGRCIVANTWERFRCVDRL